MKVEFVVDEVEFGHVYENWYMVDAYTSGLAIAGDYRQLCQFYNIYHDEQYIDGVHISIRVVDKMETVWEATLGFPPGGVAQPG